MEENKQKLLAEEEEKKRAHRDFLKSISDTYGPEATSMIKENELITRKFGEKYVFSLSSNRIIKFDMGRVDNMCYEALMQNMFFRNGLGPQIFKFKLWKHKKDECMGLVMEMLSTVASEYFMVERSEDDIKKSMSSLELYLITMCSVGLRHNDMHWGNVIILPDQNVALIDFGYSTANNDTTTCMFPLEIAQLGRSLSIHDGNKMKEISRERLFAAFKDMQRNMNKTYSWIPDPYNTMEEYNKLFSNLQGVLRPGDKTKTDYVRMHRDELQGLINLLE